MALRGRTEHGGIYSKLEIQGNMQRIVREQEF